MSTFDDMLTTLAILTFVVVALILSMFMIAMVVEPESPSRPVCPPIGGTPGGSDPRIYMV